MKLKPKRFYRTDIEYDIRLPFRTDSESFNKCLEEWKNGIGKELMMNRTSVFETFFGIDGWNSFISENNDRLDLTRLATVSLIHSFIIPGVHSYIKEIKEKSGKNIAVVEHSSDSDTNISIIKDVCGYFMPRLLYNSFKECKKLITLDFIMERGYLV